MINIVTALQCEAGPLVKALGLKRSTSRQSYRVYEKAGIKLVVSGIGKIATGTACDYIHTFSGGLPHTAWLNVGIAGHATSELGSLYVINKVSDADTHRHHYPNIPATIDIPGKALITVDQPCESYDSDFLYDMEASTYFSAAMQYSTRELVQAIKVVSDNRSSSTKEIDKNMVSRLVERNIEVITGLVHYLDSESDKQKSQLSTPDNSLAK